MCPQASAAESVDEAICDELRKSSMPTYQYRCTDCGHDLEVVQKFSDPSLTVCPNCQGALRKVFNAVGVVFKGSGFYRTDSRKPESGGESGSDSSSGKNSDKGEGKKGGSETKSGSDTGSGSKSESSSTSTKNESGSGSTTSASNSTSSSKAAASS